VSLNSISDIISYVKNQSRELISGRSQEIKRS